MIEFTITGEALWNRMERAVERVNERLRKTVRILEEAKIPYAIVGGHAVRAWVAQVDEGAVRTTKDVDVLLRRENLPDMIRAMTQNGFYHRETVGVDIFTEKPDESAREAVHVVITKEMVKPGEFDPNPDLEPQTRANDFNTIALESLVRMKLNFYRRKDQVHLGDMIEVGLIDRSWLERFPAPLSERLKIILDDPLG